MTDYTNYITATAKTTGVRSTLDVLLDRLPDDAETVARGWLADDTIDNSHCARALTAMTRDLLDNRRVVNDDVVRRWRALYA